MKVIDQLHRMVEFNYPPARIVSLVPSQSELLWALGLQKELVGITKFCIHPETMFKKITRVGGTKTVNFDKIKKLQPDLIIANKEENEKAQIEKLCSHYPVWISDIYNTEDALQMIKQLGEITGKEEKATRLVISILEKKTHFKNNQSKITCSKIAYLIWKKPYMAAGSKTFITEMLKECGFTNVFANHKERYPHITVRDLILENPDFIFLSSEPYPFKEKHAAELQQQLPQTKIILVDGEMFSWYGNRLLDAYDYFAELLRSLN